MAHKKVNAKARSKKAAHLPDKKKSWQNVIVINFVLTVIGALFLNYYTRRPEIEWIYRMLASNHAVIRENPDATLYQRMASKLRYSYVYLAYVRDNTPNSAVILFPRRDVIFRQPAQFTDGEFSIVGFDFMGRVIASEHTIGESTCFQSSEFGTKGASYTHYTPLVHLSYAYVYMLGANIMTLLNMRLICMIR